MSSIIRKIPFLRFFIPFVLGISIYLYFKPIYFYIGYLVVLYSFLITIYYALQYYQKTIFQLFFGITVNILFFFIGLQCSFYHDVLNRADHYSRKQMDRNTLFSGYIINIPKKSGEKHLKTKIKILKYLDGKKWKVTEGEIIAYLPIDDQEISISKSIVFRNKLYIIPPPKNPFEFDYSAFLRNKNIYHQAYLSKSEYRLLPGFDERNLFIYADLLKNHLLHVLKLNGLSGDNLAITSALLLGYDDEISKELLNAYSATGTLHVLSVSGLHVGIIFLVLNFLFRFPNYKIYNFLKALLMLLMIWFYAALTGLSPSVIRSAAMFSFLIFGTLINRKGNVYNTLLASAFFILLVEPNLIMDIGFQLSYVAVAGIVFYYPYLKTWWQSENKLLKHISDTTALSVSAQLTTLPLSLFYFGQFPSLFFVSNLIVIPLSYIVMFGSMLLLMLYPFAFLAKPLTYLLNVSVSVMNAFTIKLDELSFLNLTDFRIDALELILFFLLISFGSFFLIRKHYYAGIISFSIILIIIGFSIHKILYRENKLVVYQLKNATAIDLFIENKGYCFIHGKEIEPKILKIAKLNRISNGVKATKTILLKSGFSIHAFKDKKVGILTRDTLSNFDLSNQQIDYLIITGNPRVKGLENVRAKQIIIDGNNDYKTKNYIKRLALGNCWFTSENGAFDVSF